ncbi:MAG: MurR/RpiR family transcriptional regulator [Sporolactobacillus sp.]
MLFIDRLKHASNLTDNEQQISAYIEANLAAVSEMSIQALAAATYTSHSAMVRFAKKLGYEGFRPLRHAISEAVQMNIAQLNDVDANFPFRPSDSTMAIAKNMSDLTINTVKRTFAQLDEKTLYEAATRIIKAQRLFIFAIGDSQIRARSFQNKLVKINKFAVIAEEYADEAWTAANLDENDLAIFLSYAGGGKQRARIMSFLSDRRVPTLLLTGNPKSELVPYATQTIAITQTECDVLKVSTFASQITFEYLLDTLFAIVYARSYQHNLVKLKNDYFRMGQVDILEDVNKHG